MNITEKLDQLSELQAQRDTIKQGFEDLRYTIMGARVKQQLDDLDAEEDTRMDLFDMHVSELTAEIKAEVLAGGVTVKSAHLQAVYSKGASRWDMPALNRYAEDHLDLLRFKKDGEPGVTFRAVK